MRIKAGPCASFAGEVEEISEETGTLKVAVDIFARVTSVELTLAEVEKPDSPESEWPNSSNN